MWAFFDIPKRRHLGRPEVHYCDYCRADRPFDLVLAYKLAALNVIFCWVHGRQYWRVCEACGAGWRVAPEDLPPMEDPVPVWERYGWALCLFVGVVAVLVLLLVMASKPAYPVWD